MVVVKRMLNGYRPPVVPRAPRSIRKRSLLPETTQICPFELLATVAGKLLEETECSSASSSAAVGFEKCGIGKDGVKKEPRDDQGSSEGSVYFSGNQKGKAVNGEHVSPVESSLCSEKDHSKIIRDFPLSGEFDDTNVGNVVNRKLDIDDGASELLLCRESALNDSFLNQVNDVKIDCKDDNEIISRCSQPNNTRKVFRSPTRVGDRRYRKLLTSKYWKPVPKLKDCELTNAGGAAKHSYQNKRPCYEIDRSQRNTPFKKRRLFDRSSIVTYDGGISSESVSNSPEKTRDDDTKPPEGNGTLSSGYRTQNSCNSRDSHVRLSIKSFKVPELFVEVPDSTTVGSLKKTVLEAVTSILGGGLRVGILLQGKKTRDDNRTLLQVGLSQNDMGTVGFTLEPISTAQSSSIISPKESPATLLCDSPKFAHRSHLDKPSVTGSNSPTGSCRDLVPSDTKELPEKKLGDSKALVPVPDASMEALAILPVNKRAKPSEIGHRRTRRPFSVSEVEALVYAVEKLGTGRWRDVKIRSFDNATHRTYVDLKDKWKTLVHTARIAPQQRRGQPVPQELLDRVLAAQSYWSENQTKNHGKQQQQSSYMPKLTDSVA